MSDPVNARGLPKSDPDSAKGAEDHESQRVDTRETSAFAGADDRATEPTVSERAAKRGL